MKIDLIVDKKPKYKRKAKRFLISSMIWEYTSRADLSVDQRDMPQIIKKINEIIQRLNNLPKEFSNAKQRED